jgi:lysosomal alpha-mannosidase
MLASKILITLITAITLSAKPIKAECGYNACPKTDPTKLNIHIIAHSHDDVGWLKTADHYYIDSVRDIITNVVKSLKSNANRKFTQVETYFFNHWWNEQTEDTKSVVKTLVNNGQLVFTNGGWTVNDEGAAHYSNIIDQMTLGLKVLDEIFGNCSHTKVSWQIDPFGHSREMASLYAQMGFDGHVTNRGVRPQGEFVWKASHDLGMNWYN